MNISQRLEKLPMTRTMRRILLMVGIGWLFDAMDQGMVAGVLAAVGKDWALEPVQQSMLLSSGTFGMILGAALSGIAADKMGRRTVILVTLLLYSLGSFASGLAPGFEWLLVARFITGFGLGGELPAASTLVSEMSPIKQRGRNVVLLESFWAWGWILASLVAYLVVPSHGWQIAFFIGAVPALFAAILRWKVPESPRYLELAGRSEEADEIVMIMESEAHIYIKPESKTALEAPAKAKGLNLAKLWSKPYTRATAVLWVVWFGVNFGYYGFVLWTPTLLFDMGYPLVKSLNFVLIMSLAQLPGYFSAAWLIERIGRKPVLIIYFAGTAVAAWLFGNAGSETAILLTGSLLYFFALGAWGAVYSYTPEVYPTEMRGSGSGWAAAFGRIGAFIAPFIVPALYASLGKTPAAFTAVFIFLSAVFLLVAIVVAIWGKETKGKPLVETR